MSKRTQRNAYYSSLEFPYGAPSIAENRANRNAYVDSLPHPYQRDQTKPISNPSGPRGIEEKRDRRNAYYDSLPAPYQRYQPYMVEPNMPFPYYGEMIDPNTGTVISSEIIEVPSQPVIVPADLQSLSMIQQEGASGGETLAQEQQDFYSNAAGKKTGKGKGCATRPGDADCLNAEGQMDFVKSHAKLIGGVALTSVAAFTVWFVWIRK